MTSIDLLKEIESWLSFNTEPSKEETAKLRKSIKEHLAEQLRIHDVVGRSEQLPCEMCGGNIDKEDKFTDEKHCEIGFERWKNCV